MDGGTQERLVFKVIQTPDNATTATNQQPPKRARSAQHTPSTLFPCPEEASPLCILPVCLALELGCLGLNPEPALYLLCDLGNLLHLSVHLSMSKKQRIVTGPASLDCYEDQGS